MNDFLDRVLAALDARDPQQVAALFAEDYRSAQPVHPGREFVGRAQVLENWTAVFEGIPDFTAHLLSATQEGDTVYGEWEWTGTYVDGSPFAMCGLTVLVLRDGEIAEGRLYMEAVERQESTIQDSVEELYRR